MFGIDNDKLIEKVNIVVLPKMLFQEPEDLIKYNLALRYIINMSNYKKIACIFGAVASALVAAYGGSVYITAAGLTGLMAGCIETKKAKDKAEECEKLFKLILIGLKVVHFLSDEDIESLLNKVSADDLINFLEKEELTERGV